jgi:hypothetical protein
MQVQAQLGVCSDAGLFAGSPPQAYVCIISRRTKQPYGIWPVQLDAAQWGIYHGTLQLWYEMSLLPRFKAHVLAMPAAEQEHLQWLLQLPQRQLQPQQHNPPDGPPTTPTRSAQQQQQQQQLAQVTPSIKPGKAVTSEGRGAQTVGVVRRLAGAGHAVVRWPGSQREAAMQTRRLQVRPIGAAPAVRPKAAGQQVVGVYGSCNWLHGTVEAVHSEKCTVTWESGKVSSVHRDNLHALTPAPVPEEPEAAQVRCRFCSTAASAQHPCLHSVWLSAAVCRPLVGRCAPTSAAGQPAAVQGVEGGI